MLHLLWLGLVAAAAAQTTPPLVETTYGTVRGTHHETGGYSSFTGIRYGTVPTGRDRFKGPLPPTPWYDVFDADQNDIACKQISMNGLLLTGTEDCLTLNVFTPDSASPTNPVPVIVFVHGGANIFGSNGDISPEHLLPHNVVLVAINFRVSILGLLCLQHELVPGNAGYKDQVAALLWVQKNIAAFGGDPSNVTLMGHSSGSVAVDLLTLSPLTKGLIQRSISLSGTARSFWAVNADPVERAEAMARTHLGYEGNNIEALVEFYLGANDEALLLATLQEFSVPGDGALPVAACVEQTFPDVNAFLTDTPANILESGLYISIPKIVVVTDNEYVSMLSPPAIDNIPQVKENLQDYLPSDLLFHSNTERTQIANRIREFYFNNERTDLEAYIAFNSDKLFYHGAVRGARERRSTSSDPVYFLEFTYESDYRSPRLPEAADIPGVGHGDELLFLVLAIQEGATITAADRITIARFTTLFTNFAKYGNPTPDIDDLQWQSLTENRFFYLNLGSEVLTLEDPHAEAIALWDQIYAHLAIPVIQIADQGLVRGTHHADKAYTSFTGIRYATVPSDEHRFQRPDAPPTWEDVLDANENNIICPQIGTLGYIGTEDCLSLNIYKPDTASETNQLPVIVYIHGGYFFAGSNTIYGPDQLMTQDVVLVIINYRLGALGLLCLGHELIPGNAAFKDQVAALTWVKQNIASFGGDPEKVTIMGHSAGGASVDLLTLSPMADGLFSKAITLSGSARAFWALNSNSVERATAVARIIGYEGDSTEDLVQFFINATAEDLALATLQYFATIVDGSLPFAACVEDTFENVDGFLTDSPENILASGEYNSVPKIYGVTNREYVNMLLPTDVINAPQVMENLQTILPTDLNFESNQQRASIAARLREFYVTDERSALEGYVDFMSDTMFYHAVVRAVRERQAKTTAPIYVFEFRYESDLRLPRLPEVSDLKGAGHVDDAFHLIFMIEEGTPISDEDRLTTARYTTLITNFATYGNPTPQTGELLQVPWPPVTADRLRYLVIDSQLDISQTPNEAAITLWDEVYAAAAAGSSASRLLSSKFIFFGGALVLLKVLKNCLIL